MALKCMKAQKAADGCKSDDMEGILLTDENLIIRRWEEHFQELLWSKQVNESTTRETMSQS